MFNLTETNIAGYLEAHLPKCAPVTGAKPLGGGVSNTVLRVETAVGPMVLKQALAKLKVEQDWFANQNRTLRECRALEVAASLLPPGSVPHIFFLDEDNYIYAMQAITGEVRDWKQLLMAGIVDEHVAAKAGGILGQLIAASWHDAELREQFGDQTVFNELRLDPYYRTTSLRNPDLSTFFDRLILSCSENASSLVHGDWSPKNLLVAGRDVMAIDFEVVHFGEAAFDTGFLLNHLLLKSFYLPKLELAFRRAASRFWDEVLSLYPGHKVDFEKATIAHCSGLMLARMDGKSPAEYIQEEALKQRIRKFARQLITVPPATIEELWQLRETA